MKKFLSKSLPGHSRSVMRRFEKYLKNRPASLLHGTALGRKMEQACILLEGGVPMKEIAGLVGYGDVYAFSKQFSRFFGFPPGKYRARLHTDAPDLEQF